MRGMKDAHNLNINQLQLHPKGRQILQDKALCLCLVVLEVYLVSKTSKGLHLLTGSLGIQEKEMMRPGNLKQHPALHKDIPVKASESQIYNPDAPTQKAELRVIAKAVDQLAGLLSQGETSNDVHLLIPEAVKLRPQIVVLL